MSSDPRPQRLVEVNELLAVIASCGRRFFAHETRVARFELQRGHIVFVDHYTELVIYVEMKHLTWRGFSGGRTLRLLVRQLMVFIQRGAPLPENTFGSWPGWICEEDRWGYGDDMQLVRDAAIRLGLVVERAEAVKEAGNE